MITANDARANTTQYHKVIFEQVEKQVNEIIEIMSESIKFHSQNGFEQIDFAPYSKSRFPSDTMMTMAQTLLTQILEKNGFELPINNIKNNILKVRW